MIYIVLSGYGQVLGAYTDKTKAEEKKEASVKALSGKVAIETWEGDIMIDRVEFKRYT